MRTFATFLESCWTNSCVSIEVPINQAVSNLSYSASVIPNLSLGLSLSSPYLPPEKLDAFMRRMLISRISRRVLAEHHIALSEMYVGLENEEPEEPHVGIIFTGLMVKRSIEKCVKLLTERLMWLEVGGRAARDVHWPQVEIDGHLDTKFAYIREHFEYVYPNVLHHNLINASGILPSSS